MNYYNEIDPYCVQWLKNLIVADLIPDGFVDSRPIQQVQPEDLKGFTQCHFFAGIAGWALALKLVGWPEDRQVWTGSCPCQPFSVAGKRKKEEDERHLWPEFYRLIAKSRPSVVLGEQVAAATDWLTGVRSDLEAVDYAFGAMPIEAACASAAQYRDRIWFVACVSCERGNWGAGVQGPHGRPFVETSSIGELASEHIPRLEECQSIAGDFRPECAPIERSPVSSLVRDPGNGWGEGWTESEFRSRGFTAAVASLPDGTQFIECPDGKWRRLPPPRVRWLGNGIPARVAKLRAFGNGIVPQVAAEFIGAYMDSEGFLDLL